MLWSIIIYHLIVLQMHAFSVFVSFVSKIAPRSAGICMQLLMRNNIVVKLKSSIETKAKVESSLYKYDFML